MRKHATFHGFWVSVLIVFNVSCNPSVPPSTASLQEASTQVQGTVVKEQRPMIWVRPSEREDILSKISDHPTVAKYYADFTSRVADDLLAWERSPADYFNQLPLDHSAKVDGQASPFKTYVSFDGSDRKEQEALHHQLQTAIDCGVLYFLTEEDRYAQFAADVLHNFVQSVLQLPLQTGFYNAGWIYTKDHLREAREIGAQVPIIYDFVQPWLATNGQVYDLGKRQRVGFDYSAAETVFRTYADLAINRGGTGTNWPILEGSSLVGNALALSNPAERRKYLKYFLEKDTQRQDALPTIGAFYDEHGGSWPESLGYSQHVGEFLTYLFTIFSHHDPSLKLVSKYPQVVTALPEAYYLTYPGGKETILFGDGHRNYHPMLDGYEMAYHLGEREGNTDLMEIFGPLINHSVSSGNYRRFTLSKDRSYEATMYREPTKLLWFAANVPAPAGEYPLPVTTELPFAGITLQRNLSPSGRAEDGLMGFVGGSAYVHGHATGMSMELFGKGFVLGSKGGRTRYRTEIHENYYRIFASNNTVVVNGASRSNGGWVNLGTDGVKRVAAEPPPGAAPVSANFSFSTSTFLDTIGTGAEAKQERTLGIIRTTDSTGYYVDLFRSDSELPQQYHDYIYRNVGDRLYLMDDDGDIDRKPTPERYRANANGEWRQNRAYRHPGWHYFEDVKTSVKYGYNALAIFVADSLGPETIEMWAHMPVIAERTFTTATSPPLTEGPQGYRDKRAPTLVVRQEGAAWDTPFTTVFEPVKDGQNSVAAVETIWRERRCEGLVVKSNERAGGMTQLILIPAAPAKEVTLAAYDLRFKGKYCVLTYAANAKLQSAYVGSGSILNVGAYQLRPVNNDPMAVFVNFSQGQPQVTTSNPIYLKQKDGPEQIIRPKK